MAQCGMPFDGQFRKGGIAVIRIVALLNTGSEIPDPGFGKALKKIVLK